MGTNPSFQEIQLRPTDLASIRSTWHGPTGTYSVLETPATVDQINFENPALFDAGGKLHEHLADKVAVLANPRALSGLMCVSGQHIIDTVVCRGADGQTVALTSADRSLWLQYPAPVVPVVETVEKGLLDPEGELPQFDLTLTITQAFVFWGMIDILHQWEGGDLGRRFTVKELAEAFDRPARMAELLAPYYRDCLQIPLPSPQAVQAACEELAAKELVGRIGQDFLPGDLVIAIARALTAITWHAVLKAAVRVDGDQPAGIQTWLLQGVSGLGMMWSEADGSVSIASLTREQIADTVGQTLWDPTIFFSKPQTPATVISAKVPVPPSAPAPVYAAPIPQPKPKRTKWVVGCFAAAAVLLVLCLLMLGVLGLMAAYPDIFFGP
jgi:hypothetical protein